MGNVMSKMETITDCNTMALKCRFKDDLFNFAALHRYYQVILYKVLADPERVPVDTRFYDFLRNSLHWNYIQKKSDPNRYEHKFGSYRHECKQIQY